MYIWTWVARDLCPQLSSDDAMRPPTMPFVREGTVVPAMHDVHHRAKEGVSKVRRHEPRSEDFRRARRSASSRPFLSRPRARTFVFVPG